MPLRQIVIDSDLDPEIQEAFVEAAEEWFAMAPELRVRVSIATPGNVSMSNPGDPSCAGRYGYTYLSIAQPPAIRLCPREKPLPPERLNGVIRHELGHALAARGDHLADGNTMQSAGSKSRRITDADVRYVRGE